MKRFQLLFLAFVILASCFAEEEEGEKKKDKKKASIEDDYSEEEMWTITKTCYFDIEVDDESLGRITIGLFGDVAPITTNNFAALCKGNYNGESNFGYKGTRFHRVVQDFIIQGGDITAHDGSGGKSVYGPLFNDEPMAHKHAGPGYVSMANKGVPDTNSSQFFIILQRFRWLDTKHVVFGKVIEGMDIVEKISDMDTKGDTGEPKKDVIIIDSGLIKHEQYLLPENQRQ
jgi:peptidyl-prolyl cis-trans isomerase B (cyclophilin B)